MHCKVLGKVLGKVPGKVLLRADRPRWGDGLFPAPFVEQVDPGADVRVRPM